MTNYDRIVTWNEERDLIKTPEDLDVTNNMSFVLEEVIESLTHMESKEAREHAYIIAQAIRKGNVEELTRFILRNKLDEGEDIEIEPEQVVDASGDAIVFLTGLIRKQGYNPNTVMDEILTEIESRTGEMKGGKYIKDKSPEAQARWYKADFNKAKL